MMEQIELKNAPGRILTDFSLILNEILLIFDGNAFVYLKIDDNWDGPEISEAPLDVISYSELEFVRTGVITQKELNRKREEDKNQYIKHLNEKERAEYERLKLKFEK